MAASVADERFEDRHRELRKAAEKVDHRTAYDLTNAWPKLEGFEARTGPLVDDLVAVHRRLVGLLRDSTDNPVVTFSGVDLVQFAIRLGRTLSDSEIALAALDEAGRPGGT